MHFKSTIVPMLLGAAVPSVSVPVNEKLDVKVDIKLNPSVSDSDSVRASNPVPQGDTYYSIEGSFQLQVGSYPVGAASEAAPGWYYFTILDSSSSVANYTLTDGILRQDTKTVERYFVEDLSLRPKPLFVTELSNGYRQPTRWKAFSNGGKRVLGFLDGGEYSGMVSTR